MATFETRLEVPVSHKVFHIHVSDTLAWVYYKRGAYRTAIDLFEEGD